jgi:hypothetical protein
LDRDSAFRLGVALAVLVPTAAAACPVCFSAGEERRAAFTATAVLLSLAPLVLLALLGLLFARARRQHETKVE